MTELPVHVSLIYLEDCSDYLSNLRNEDEAVSKKKQVSPVRILEP